MAGLSEIERYQLFLQALGIKVPAKEKDLRALVDGILVRLPVDERNVISLRFGIYGAEHIFSHEEAGSKLEMRVYKVENFQRMGICLARIEARSINL